MKKILRLLLAAAVSGAGLWFALRGIAWEDVRGALTQARGVWFLGLIPVATLAEYGLRTERWRILLGRPAGERGALFPTVAGAFFLNTVLPFRAGEAARVYWTHRRSGRPVAGCVAALAVDRLWDMGCVATLIVVALAGERAASLPAAVTRGLGVGLGGGVVGLLLLIHGGASLRAWASRARLPEAVQRGVGAFIDGASALRSPRSFAAVGALSAALWALNVFLLQRTASVFSLELSWTQSAWLLGGIAFGVALPSTPGYVGTFEAAGVAALAVLEVDPVRAFAFVAVFHACQILGTVLWGLPGAWRAGRGPAAANVIKSAP